MIRKITLSLGFLTLVPLCSFAGVKVSSLDLRTSGSTGHIDIVTSGRSSELPDLKVVGQQIEITIDKAEPFDSISKDVRGAVLSANVLNGRAVIKALLPYEVLADQVNLAWKNSGIEVSFPRGKVAKAARAVEKSPEITPAAPVAIVAKPKMIKESLNEDYLNKLMKENQPEKKEDSAMKKDEVSLKQASPVKPEASVVQKPAESLAPKGNDFSFAGYAAKFTVFLAVVLGLFYGVVQLLKKGVFNKGKLGFLNNTQMIEVLSTTYVAPKRTLMVVRAHKQIFLVANSETGFTFLAEMTDTSGLIKEGERQLTGTNFDLGLEAAEENQNDMIKLKENIMESTPVREEKGLAALAIAKDDIVKFSDELKKKAKKLKPIEFN